MVGRIRGRRLIWQRLALLLSFSILPTFVACQGPQSYPKKKTSYGSIDELRFERVGAFPYSIEEGTLAAEMPDQVPEDVKNERLEAVLDQQRDVSYEANLRLVGRKMDVLVDYITSDDPSYGAVGRTRGQALEVDGQTHLIGGSGLEAGRLVSAQILDAEEYDLIARVVDD